ncbi:retrieval of early ER protein Rer1 [Caulochytrium protostelioides]|uniref:Protein RER1 n=1 Tax=Caulochytrium protostelioides TaxID=1555241 RepID=A0A4P9WY87_9FUNG|nr:retrieval of early ER protein Rer1 [Caulochytrium protostelioides]
MSQYEHLLDQLRPFTLYRWGGTLVMMLLFVLRILWVQGWYIVTYAWGIFLLNLFLGFLSPKFDPGMNDLDNDADAANEGPALPTKADDEFRPFVRKLPEFTFWVSTTRATLLAFVCSFFRVFDVPVFWPILLVYFFLLFGLTMRRQIRHMAKYKYVPWTAGKKNYHRPSSAGL